MQVIVTMRYAEVKNDNKISAGTHSRQMAHISYTQNIIELNSYTLWMQCLTFLEQAAAAQSQQSRISVRSFWEQARPQRQEGRHGNTVAVLQDNFTSLAICENIAIIAKNLGDCGNVEVIPPANVQGIRGLAQS